MGRKCLSQGLFRALWYFFLTDSFSCFFFFSVSSVPETAHIRTDVQGGFFNKGVKKDEQTLS